VLSWSGPRWVSHIPSQRKVSLKKWQILTLISKRKQIDFHHGQPANEILAKLSVPYHGPQVAILWPR
jgi:hypothetical protein